LTDYLRDAPVESMEKTLPTIVRNLIAAIESIHSVGIVHGDIKLDNIILDLSTLSVQLIDFESARELIRSSPVDSIATVPYTAPDGILASNYYTIEDASCDIYCFGMVICELTLGRRLSRDFMAAIPEVDNVRVALFTSQMRKLITSDSKLSLLDGNTQAALMHTMLRYLVLLAPETDVDGSVCYGNLISSRFHGISFVAFLGSAEYLEWVSLYSLALGTETESIRKSALFAASKRSPIAGLRALLAPVGGLRLALHLFQELYLDAPDPKKDKTSVGKKVKASVAKKVKALV
jgi:serine/threonine protein kinase